MSEPEVNIQLLGGFMVTVSGRPVDSAEWRRRQAASLVKILALSPGHSLHRERLIDALWPDLDVETAAPRLHKAAHFARRSLGSPDSVVLAADSVELFPGRIISVDAIVFEAEVQDALARADPKAASAAADRYRGHLLPEDPYEPWVEQHREQLRMLQLDALRLASRWDDIVAMEPTDEEAHLAITRGLAAAGNVRAALRQIERLEGELRGELGVAPSRPVREFREQLLQREHQQPTAAPEMATLVGRGREQAVLSQGLPDGRTSSGGVVFVTGAAGMGKTTLLRWLEDEASTQGLAVGVGVAARVEGEWPYAPVLEALSDLCRRNPDVLAQLAAPLRREIEEAISGRTTSWDGQGAHQRLFVAVAELLSAAARKDGLVLIIDDAHLADQASLTLLHHAARAIASLPASLVFGHRSVTAGPMADLVASLTSRGRTVTLDVRPLDRDAAFALARAVTPDAEEALLETLFQKTGGMPFGIIELARESIRDPSDANQLVWIPPGLSSATASALSRAAVLGMTFDTDELEGMASQADANAFDLVDEALAHRVIVRAEGGYRFRHSLIRESFLHVLSPRERSHGHLHAARTLGELRRSPARVGHHLVEAGHAYEAVPMLLAAAETEAAHGAYRDALVTLDRIADHASGSDRLTLLSLRADLLNALADPSAVDAYRHALAAQEADADDRPRQTRLLTRLARAATAAGDLETAEIALAKVELDGSDNDPEVLLARGNLAFQRQDYDAADLAASEARQMIGVSGEPWQLFDLIALQGLLAHLRGEWFQRLRVELRNTVTSPQLAVGIFDSHLCVAEFLLYGPTPYDQVLLLAEQLRASAREAGVLRAVAFATALRGEAALLKGDLELAEAELLDAVDLHHDLGSSAGEAHSLQRLAEVHLARGDRRVAEPLLHRALPLARWSPIAPHLLQRVYGSLIEAAPDPVAAIAVLERAESTLANEDDCQLCTIMLDLPAARAAAAVGDGPRASRYLESAEVSAARWEGTAWHAAVIETRAVVAHHAGRGDDAQRLMAEAATLFEGSGQPLDAARCRTTADELLAAAH